MAHQSHPCWSCQWPDSWLLGVFFPGLSPPLQDVLRIAVVAAAFAAVSGWGLIFPICQSEKLRISESAVRGQPNPHFPFLVEESKDRCCGKSW